MLVVTTAQPPRDPRPLDTTCDDPDTTDLRFLWPPAPALPAPAPAREPPPPPVPPDRKRWLSRLAPVVSDCTHTFGDPDARAASVALTFDRRGSLIAANLPGAPRVGACIVARLASRRLPANSQILHTFRWTPNK